MARGEQEAGSATAPPPPPAPAAPAQPAAAGAPRLAAEEPELAGTAASPAPAQLDAAAAPAAAMRRFPPPALRVRAYRWYWLSQWPVLTATWMEIVALGYLVYQVTGSTAAVSVVAAADGLPAFVLPVLGGALADRFARRRILLVTQTVLGLSAGGLAMLAGTGHAWFPLIVLVAFIFGSTDSLDLPTRQALVADLVERDLVVNAVALGSMAMSASRIVGPSLAGLLIATAGPTWCFGALAAAYLGPIIVLLTVIPDQPPADACRGSARLGVLTGALEALRLPVVRTVLACAATLSFLGVAYMPFLPVFAREQLGGDSRVLGLLYSTGGLGGLVAGLAVASLRRGAGRRPMLVVGGPVYAAGLFTLTHSRHLALALPALVAISFGFVLLNTALTTLLQTETPAAMRGRTLGLYVMVLGGLQPLGTLMYGTIAAMVPLFEAIGVGGIVVGAVAVLAAARGVLAAPSEPARAAPVG